MVLAERNNDGVRNGRRSRGPSPNGHGSPESSTDDENVVPFPAEKIRVGRDYQAICPELESADTRKPDLLAERALLVWSPTLHISDTKLDEYITVSKEKYGYNGEQALGMLFWHKHDLERAVQDLANFTPFPDEWTVEDKVLFEQAFQFHGKSFHRIRQMLPDKSIASLVKYYYSWKKTRARSSAMDRAAHVRREGSPDRASDRASDDRESDAEEKVGQEGVVGRCTGCGIYCNKTTVYNSHKLCNACHTHARRTGSMRPVCGPVSRRGGPKQGRFKHKLPRGIYINYDDLVAMAAAPEAAAAPDSPAVRPSSINRGDFMLKVMDREIVSLKRQVQNNKQQISSLKRKTSESIDDFRPGEVNSKLNARWTNDELLLAVQGVRKYGKDFQAIAETIGTKTESHMRSFWATYRRRYNLDSVLKEWEAEKGGTASSSSSVQPLSPSNSVSAVDAMPSHDGSNVGNGATAMDEGPDTSASNTNGSGAAIGTSSTPLPAKDDKMEVDSEGCALGSIAEQGGAPTTPSKPPNKSAK